MKSPSNPQSTIRNFQSPPLPRWLKRNVPKGNANHFTARLIGQLGLQTVCDHANARTGWNVTRRRRPRF